MIKQRLQEGLHGRIVRGLGMLVAALSLCSFVLVGTAAPAFAKTYDAVIVKVPVAINLSGDTAAEDLISTVTIAPAEGETLMPENGTVTIKGAGTADFVFAATQQVSSTEHHYTVTQTTADTDGWTLDTATYDVTVYVQWNEKEDVLEPVVLIHKTTNPINTKSAVCDFTNDYTAPAVQPSETPSEPASQAADKTATAGMPDTSDTNNYTWAVIAVVAVALIACGVYMRTKKDDKK